MAKRATADSIVNLLTEAQTTMDYIIGRTDARIMQGYNAGEAVMDVLAKVDPDFYTTLIGTKHDMYRRNEQDVDSFWDFLYDHYSSIDAYKVVK